MPPPPPTVAESPNGSISSESEETPIESFNNLSSLEKPESEISSDYDGSYFMNVPANSGEEAQSFDYIQNWSSSNQDLPKEPDPSLEDPSTGNNINNGNAWYGGNETPPTTSEPSTNPFLSRGRLMNKGASYLDNLSTPDASPSSGINEVDSYSDDSPREELSQQDGPSQPVFPERIKAAYRDWCQYYGKEYNETRLRTFSSNFLAVERYHRETGVSLILNDLADMTSEEFQQNK